MAYDENGDWEDDVDGDWKPPQDTLEHGVDGGVDQTPVNNNSGGSDKSQDSMKSDLGDLYTEGAYDEWAKRDFDPGWYDRIVNKENLRADNDTGETYHEDGNGGYLSKGAGSTLLGSASGSGGGSGAGSGGSSGSKMDDVYGYLKKLFPDGGFNQDVVNRRVDNVRGQLNTQRNSTMKNNEAYLAEHGLIGSGPQADAANSLDSRLFSTFGQSVNDITASESENADRRMMQALQMATGMSEAEAQDAIEQYRADTDRQLGQGNLAARNREGANSFILGQGNLALGNYDATNRYNLGAGNLQLDREKLQELIESGDTDAALRYLQLLQQGAQVSANGQQS